MKKISYIIIVSLCIMPFAVFAGSEIGYNNIQIDTSVIIDGISNEDEIKSYNISINNINILNIVYDVIHKYEPRDSYTTFRPSMVASTYYDGKAGKLFFNFIETELSEIIINEVKNILPENANIEFGYQKYSYNYLHEKAIKIMQSIEYSDKELQIKLLDKVHATGIDEYNNSVKIDIYSEEDIEYLNAYIETVEKGLSEIVVYEVVEKTILRRA